MSAGNPEAFKSPSALPLNETPVLTTALTNTETTKRKTHKQEKPPHSLWRRGLQHLPSFDPIGPITKAADFALALGLAARPLEEVLDLI